MQKNVNEWMTGVSGHNLALVFPPSSSQLAGGWWDDSLGMNNHASGAGSITIDLQSSALPLCYGCSMKECEFGNRALVISLVFGWFLECTYSSICVRPNGKLEQGWELLQASWQLLVHWETDQLQLMQPGTARINTHHWNKMQYSR